ncbi:hypothetical protein ACWDWS_02225 [Streptomyces sp. NPDC003328]
MELLKEVVSERPEYSYSSPEFMTREDGMSCFYVHKDEEGNNVSAGCAIGVVLNRLGVPLEELEKYEGMTSAQIVPKLVTGVQRKTVHVLNAMQAYQDEHMHWGEAYAKATGETI